MKRYVPEQEVAPFEMMGLEIGPGFEEVTISTDSETKSKDIEVKENERWGEYHMKTDTALLKEITEGYETDVYFARLLEHLKNVEEGTGVKIPKDLQFPVSKLLWDAKEGLIYRKLEGKLLLCLPRVGNIILNRLLEAHDSPLGGHFGRDKTLSNLAKNFWWPGLVKDVEDYVKSCANCQ